MVSVGKFVIHSRAVPPLVAGDYVLEGTQAIDAGSARPTATNRTNIRVTSARYRLPPDQILSVFPPANSEGAYEERLPQIVIKRRALPWERELDPADRTIPWMALVVIAEGEGEISAEANINECVTAGVRLDGPNDVAKGICLIVPQSTVTKVFPTRQDLALLTHVREVNLEDTELASGDDDGFLAVVMANRLPQFDRVACKPVRYTACLVNLEGQLAALPPPSVPLRSFDALSPVFDIQTHYVSAAAGGGSPDIAMMTTGPAAAVAVPNISKVQTAKASAGAATDWLTTTRAIESVALTAASDNAAFAVRDAMKGGFRIPIEGIVLEKVYRFPLLAHWSFTCDGGGSFETLMRGLDVGLLGTLQGEGAKNRRPDCAPTPVGAAPPDPPRPRPAAEVTETGHVGLAHQTRAGDLVRAWYRGPFVPSPTTREVATTPQGPALAHTSDQLRAVTPDGREDLSLSVAFEMGRLLALSRPAVVTAMLKWRREQFGAERARRLSQLAAKSIGALRGVLSAGVVATLGPMIGRTLVMETATKLDRVLGPKRPSVDPGRPIPFLKQEMVGDILKAGLAIDPAVLTQLQRTGSTAALDALTVPTGGKASDKLHAHLTGLLQDEVQRLAVDALARSKDGPRVRKSAVRRQGDALDALMSEMTAARQRKEQ